MGGGMGGGGGRTTIVLKKVEIHHLFICVTMRVKHISLIHIVYKSSKFNIGLNEFVIVVFYCSI